MQFVVSNMMKWRLLSGILVGSLLQAASASPWEYPETMEKVEVHTYGSVQLSDPFAWLEEKGPEGEAWFRAQDAFARDYIESLPMREGLYQRIKEIDEAKALQIYSFDRVGERYFYLRQEVGEEVGRLFYRDGIEGEEHLVADPAAFGETDGVYSIDYYSPSWDGQQVGVAITAGGSEIPDLFVLEVETGKMIGEAISRVRGSPSWLEDNSGFFYRQMRPEEPEQDQVDRYKRQPVKFHRMNTDPEKDPVILSYDENPSPGLSDVDSPYISTIPGTPYTGLYVGHGVDRASSFFLTTDLDLEDPSRVTWLNIAERADSVETIALHEDQVFLLSFKDAPRRQVLVGSLANYDKDELTVLLPEGERVLTGLQVLGGRLYVTAMQGGVDELLVYDPKQPESGFRTIDMPLIGRITLLANDYREPDVFLSLTTWTRAPAYYRYDPATGDTTLSPLRPLGPFDSVDGLVAKRVMVPSHDGTEVPLTIVHLETVKLDGRNPTILNGYGAYGISLRPAFGPTRLAWFEKGGIFAVAHVRGGGEFGKEWHEGGHIETKRNSWLDFHACAEYLIEHHYTSPEYLAAQGGSMGGVLVGRAMTSRPDLYGAVVSSVGNHNPVRNHRRANGPGNYPEYGNPTDPEEFPYVLAMDSYFAVRDGVEYPPMLLTSGYNDSRVDPWMPGKMAARLQQANPRAGPFLLRVEFDAGHGGVARSDFWAEAADVYAFLFSVLGPGQEKGGAAAE